jgi:hypothetical protein
MRSGARGEATRPWLGALAYLARMGETFGGSSATYWRRRFIVLVTGLTVLGVAAWGLSDALAVSPARTGRSSTHSRSPARPASTRPTASPTARPARTQRAHLSGIKRRDHSSRAVGQANGHGTILPAFCGRRDVVLSIYTGQTQYSGRQRPQFDLSVVSTQQANCSFNIGSRHLALVIKEGPARIWSSADCAAGAGGLIAALERGVPTVLTISWDRQTSAPGCSAPARQVPAGSYTAYAVDGTLTSALVSFRLG